MHTKSHTTAELNHRSAEPHKASEIQRPEYIRLPKSGTRCAYTGLSRSALNSLILGTNAPVRSRSVKQRYAVRGIRLIHLGSLLDFIEAQVDSPADAEQHEAGTPQHEIGTPQKPVTPR